MACAVFWKLFGGQYFNGSFMYYTMLTDPRIEGFTNTMGGLSHASLLENRMLLHLWGAGLSEGSMVQLNSNQYIHIISLALSFFTLAVELFIAMVFLMGNKISPVWRHLCLIFFILTVYPVAPVIGFGCILIAMAIADVPEEYFRIRVSYLGVLSFTLLANVWNKLFDYFYRFLEILG